MMKQLKIFRHFALVAGILFFTINTKAHEMKIADTSLSPQQIEIITISSFTATGDLIKLKTALNAGLEAGLTINEIKEVLVHLYAYCGFPRSIRGLQTFMEVLDERKKKGVSDEVGKEPILHADERNKYQRGVKTLYELTGLNWGTPKSGYGAFAPVIDTFLKEHLFADIFERDVLNYAQRELVTISVLSSIGGVEPMLRSHLNICLNVGLTPNQLQQFVEVIHETAGRDNAEAAQNALNEILKNRK